MPEAEANSSVGLVERPEAKSLDVLRSVVSPEALDRLNVAYTAYGGALASRNLTEPERALLSAVGVQELTKALSGEIYRRVLLPLCNSALGFDTDRNPQKGFRGEPYDEATVVACCAHAILFGLPITGNRWNIIAGGMYPRKEGFEALLAEIVRMSVGVDLPPITPDLFQNGGYVMARVRIKYRDHQDPEDSEPKNFVREYRVRLNAKNKTGPESLEGKAKRKAFRDLYHALSGLMLPDGEVGDGPSVIQVAAPEEQGGGGSRADALASRLQKPEECPPSAPRLAGAALKHVNAALKSAGLKPGDLGEFIFGLEDSLPEDLEGNPGEDPAAFFQRCLDAVAAMAQAKGGA